jgi:peptide/nickel transport system substrate-binding protein
MRFRSVTTLIAGTALLAVGSVAPAGASSASGLATGDTIPSFTIGTVYSLNTLDPRANQIFAVGSLSLEDLLQLGRQGQLEPDLATSWSEPNPVTYIYHIRQGVKFWDGNELTAADAAYSLNWERAPVSDEASFFPSSVESITATGPYTLVVKLSHPDASWQWVPASYNAEIFEAKFAEDHKGTFGKPGTLVMGTGPWIVDSLDPTTGAEFSANPHWWGGKVPIQHISYKIFSTETSLGLAMRAGEVDLDPLIVDPKSFEGTSGAKIVSVAAPSDVVFSMNTQIAPWNDVHVRRAVDYALDRPDLIIANGGYAVPTYTLIPPQQLGQIASPSQIAGLLKSVPLYEYNLAKAKAEMAESAYPKGFSATLVEGVYGSTVNMAEVAAAELQKIGIHLQVKAVPSSVWGGEITGPAKQRPTSLYDTGTCGVDVSCYTTLLLGSRNLAQGQWNTADYSPPAIDKLITAGLAANAPAQRFAVYSKLLTQLANDVPYVPVCAQDYAIALNPKFTVAWYTANFAYGDYPLLVRPAA